MTDVISSKVQKLEENDNWSFFETEAYKSNGEDNGRSFIHINGAKGDIDITIGFPMPSDVNGTLYIARRDDAEMMNVPVLGKSPMRAPLDEIRATLEAQGFGELVFLATRAGIENFCPCMDFNYMDDGVDHDVVVEDAAPVVSYGFTHAAPHDRKPGEAIDRVTEAMRALRQGEVVADEAAPACCGKWVVFDARDAAPAPCGCAHPANDVTAIDAFLDDYDALFGERVAA
ncbi:hypothetical protein [Sphingomonas sp. CV7422]|uniref:hypothetical protein n=1 Tax=Sphingomonas sp. CV7422 TaxID=3018036 RepID=UPI0022FEA009|nr:hypothetical protein [Sphingomonas sp. CV7422]